MSAFSTRILTPLQFHRSSPSPCPYLPGRIERKLFARLSGPEAAILNSSLSQAGFRRSHDIIYRPACPGCQACIAVRVRVADFTPSQTQKRVLARTAYLRPHLLPCSPTPEQYALFSAYQAARHGESDMARMNQSDYNAMLLEGAGQTILLQLQTADAMQTLHGVMLTDQLADGLSAVYSFFSVGGAYERQSLGTALILALIEAARSLQLPYVYLGYWVEQSRKMAYKQQFRPLEAFGPDGWKELTPAVRQQSAR